MSEQIEAEVMEPASGAVSVPATERWMLWHVHPERDGVPCRWVYDATVSARDTAESMAALRKQDGYYVRIVHYTLPALTIKAEENTNDD